MKGRRNLICGDPVTLIVMNNNDTGIIYKSWDETMKSKFNGDAIDYLNEAIRLKKKEGMCDIIRYYEGHGFYKMNVGWSINRKNHKHIFILNKLKKIDSDEYLDCMNECKNNGGAKF
jgi:hypothetical protein